MSDPSTWARRGATRFGVASPRKAPAHRAASRRTPEWHQVPDSVVAWGWYVDGHRQDVDDLPTAVAAAGQDNGFVWMGLKDPTDEDMAGFAHAFGLHPLAIEDAVEGHSRSKLEDFGDTLFSVITTVSYVDKPDPLQPAEVVSTGQIMVFTGSNFVLTVRRGDHSPLQSLRESLEAQPRRLALGPHFVLYSVYDTVVDDYMQVVAEIEEDVDDVEEAVFAPRAALGLDRVYELKREVIEFRRCVSPLSLPLTALSTHDLSLIPTEARAYFREVADHLTEARESVASFDAVLTDLLQAGLARVSLKDNQDMRKMSSWLAIVAVPTTVGAVYGMNFRFMPELDYRYSYFIVVGLMALVMLGLYLLFRRKHWL